MKKIPDMKELGLSEIDPKDRTLYMMWESSHARAERVTIRLWIVILVLIVALIGTNAGWIWYESQFEEVVTNTETVTQEATADGNSDIKFIGGDYYVGEGETDNNENINNN